MVIKNTNNKITITLNASIDKFGLERLIGYLKFLEATSKSTAMQSNVDKLADEINESWWEENKSRFII